MKIKAAFLADSANETADGKANILGVFTAINTMTVPTYLPQCTLIIIVLPNMEDVGTAVNINVEWRDPESQVLLKTSFKLEILAVPAVPLPPANVIAHIQGLPATHFGPHELHAFIEGAPDETTLWTVDVRPVSPEDRVSRPIDKAH